VFPNLSLILQRLATLWTFSPGIILAMCVAGKKPTSPVLVHLPFHQSQSEVSRMLTVWPGLISFPTKILFEITAYTSLLTKDKGPQNVADWSCKAQHKYKMEAVFAATKEVIRYLWKGILLVTHKDFWQVVVNCYRKYPVCKNNTTFFYDENQP